MPDEAALCALTQLNDTQFAGLETLAGMDDAVVEAFAARVEAAWQENHRAVIDAKQAVPDAIAEVAVVEQRCYAAARARDAVRPVLTEAEKGAIREAVAEVDAARARIPQTQARFKAGITDEQLGAG